MGHLVGRVEADGWSATTADRPERLVYGPYTRDIPAGRYDVAFRMMIDNNSADNAIVAHIDINDFDGGRVLGCGNCIMASSDIRRMDFTNPHLYQVFVLSFTSPGPHRLEFRTAWTGRAYIREDRVTVRTSP